MCAVKQAERGTEIISIHERRMHENYLLTSSLNAVKQPKSDASAAPSTLLLDSVAANLLGPCHCGSNRWRLYGGTLKRRNIVVRAQDP